MKHHRIVFFYSFIVALGGFVFGLDAAVISGTINFITVQFGLSDLQIGAVVSAPGFGVIFALLITGYLVDKYGRKGVLILIAALYLVSAICSAFAPTFETLVAARFLGGLAFTSLSVSAMYIGEISPPALRGKMVAMNQVNIVIDLSAAYFINYLIIKASNPASSFYLEMGENQWRWMLASEIIPAAAWLLLLFIVPQSPRWLFMKGRYDEAKVVLKKIMPAHEIDAMYLELKQNESNSTQEEGSFVEKFKEIFDNKYKKIFWIGLSVAVIQPITGINAILFYAPTVFEQAGVGTDTAFVQAVYIGLVSLVFTLIAFLLIDKVGRRPLTIFGLFWAALSLGVCTYGFNKASYSFTPKTISVLKQKYPEVTFDDLNGKQYASDVVFKEKLKLKFGENTFRKIESDLLTASVQLPATLILLGILCFIAAFQLSIGPVLWVILSEIFPTHLRGVAIPTFAFVVSVVSYFVQQFFPWQLTHMGAKNIFLFYATVTAAGAFLLLKILPETKNKTIEEITNALQ